jgi:hypothetical protein
MLGDSLPRENRRLSLWSPGMAVVSWFKRCLLGVGGLLDHDVGVWKLEYSKRDRRGWQQVVSECSLPGRFVKAVCRLLLVFIRPVVALASHEVQITRLLVVKHPLQPLTILGSTSSNSAHNTRSFYTIYSPFGIRCQFHLVVHRATPQEDLAKAPTSSAAAARANSPARRLAVGRP